MWDLCQTKRHWGRFLPSTSVSPANHSTNCSTLVIIYLSPGVGTTGQIVAQSHPTSRNKQKLNTKSGAYIQTFTWKQGKLDLPKYLTQAKIQINQIITKNKNKLHGLSPRVNYTDRATAACRRSDCQLLRMVSGQRDGSLRPYFSVF
jgi:hypothetical protein